MLEQYIICVAGKTLLLLVQNEHNGQTVRLAGENGTSGDPAGLLAATTFLVGGALAQRNKRQSLAPVVTRAPTYATYLDCTA